MVSALGGCGGVAAHRRAALEAAERGDVAGALVEHELDVAERPGDREAWAALGRAQLAAGRPGAALRSFDRAARAGLSIPERAELLVRRAGERTALGEVDRWRDLDAAIAADPVRGPGLRAALASALGQAAVLRARAGDDAGARRLATRVRDLGGLASAPAPSPPPVEVALLDGFSAWLRGEADAFPGPDVAWAVATDPATPAWLRALRPSLLGEDGTAGDPGAGLADAGAVPAEARLLVAFEQARARRHALRPLAGADPLLEALARASSARAAGDEAAAQAALASARRYPGGELALARRGEVEALAEGLATTAPLERYRRIAPLVDGRGDAGGARSDAPVGPAREVNGLPGAPAVPDALGPLAARAVPPARPGCRRDDTGFLLLRQAVARDLALAERRARAYVDGELALGCRAADAALELARAAPGSAVPFAAALVDENPDSAPAHLLLARLLARAGDPARARLELDAAEALAEERGPSSLLLADDLRAAGEPIAALGAARQALALAEGAERAAALERAVQAALAAGRDEDAATLFAALRGELPPALVPAAAARIAAARADSAPAWLPPTPPPRPGSVAALARDAAGAGRQRARRALLLVGLAHDGPRGRHALLALAVLLAEDGRADLARAARGEAALLAGPGAW